MEGIESYIFEDLIVLIPVLYLMGMAFKRSQRVKDKHIPFAVGGIGVLLACIYEFATLGVCWDALFDGLVQGILCAGAAVLVNQAYKQGQKVE